MKSKFVFLLFIVIAVFLFSFRSNTPATEYTTTYNEYLVAFRSSQAALVQAIDEADLSTQEGVDKAQRAISLARLKMKAMDFWFRYLEPLAYKRINGPLPVEWETEVFEKFEPPYKREAAGFILASLYLDEEQPQKDSLKVLLSAAYQAAEIFAADSITKQLSSFDHFYLCNRLYLLNLAAIYTTGFECPDTDAVIPELHHMMQAVYNTYEVYNTSFSETALTPEYMLQYRNAINFVAQQPTDYIEFDHYSFLKDYINPLYRVNQQLINKYKAVSKSLIDYSLTKDEVSIFDKALYNGQDPRGIFLRVRDEAALKEIDKLGKMLFYDPILSGNNLRSCASCHKPSQYFTDTAVATAFHFNHKDFLLRNTPSLLNAQYNHLLMADGKQYTMQHQAKFVIGNGDEMDCDEKEVMRKVLSCNEYKIGFEKLLKYTPLQPEISFDHVVSALTYYYSKFSQSYALFDEAMNNRRDVAYEVKQGFNLFMGKAQCATCHFVPQFNGVKPPYIGSEFEVLGVPADTSYTALSQDRGRFDAFAADEMMHAFRTGTVRNAEYTKPYMHNGVFNTLEQVLDFYDAGGGIGHGLILDNQTLSADSLKLTKPEKQQLIAFIKSLSEKVAFEDAPQKLPKSKIKSLNTRRPGGIY